MRRELSFKHELDVSLVNFGPCKTLKSSSALEAGKDCSTEETLVKNKV